MRRRLLKVLTALSLLLCVAVCVQWAQGRSAIDAYEDYRPRFGWGLYTGGGRVVLECYFGSDRAEMVPRAYAHRRLPLAFGPILDQRDAEGTGFDFNHGGFRFFHRRVRLSN
jgi:hypothetical protein